VRSEALDSQPETLSGGPIDTTKLPRDGSKGCTPVYPQKCAPVGAYGLRGTDAGHAPVERLFALLLNQAGVVTLLSIARHLLQHPHSLQECARSCSMHVCNLHADTHAQADQTCTTAPLLHSILCTSWARSNIQRMYARSYLKINTMFGVAKAHGLTTTWSDKASGYVVRGPQYWTSVPHISPA